MTIALEQTVTGTNDSSSITLTSWTPQANELVLVFLAKRNEVLASIVSGNGLTWVQVADVDNTQGQNGCTVYRAMGSPTTGSIVISNVTEFDVAVACRFSGVDTTGTHGSGAVEATATAPGPAVDDNDMQVSIATLTDTAWAIAVGTHRNRSFTVPGSQTAISINNTLGSGGDVTTCSVWYKAISPAGATTLGGANSLNANTDWCAIAISIKPPTTTDYQQSVAGTVALAGVLTTLKGTLYTQAAAGTVTLAGAVVAAHTAYIPPPPIPPNRRRGTIFSQNNLAYLIGRLGYSLTDYTQDVISYGHSHQALGGMWSADLTLRQPLHDLEDWIENGVGRHIEARGGGAAVAWEGIVNRVTISIGGYNMTVGPYLDISNKINLAYSMFVDLGGGQMTGIRLVTNYVQNAASIARYGILENTFSAGGISGDNVADLLQMLIERYSRPPRSEDLNLQGNLAPQFDLKLECVGYAHLFSKYGYNSSTTGTVALSTKLADIVNSEPNGRFTSRATANTMLVPAYENDNAEAWGLIKSLVAFGDTSQNRYTFGVYEDRRATYKPVDNAIVYIRPLREGVSVIQDIEGGLLQPWQVRPGGYVMVTDLLPGRPTAPDLNDDVRAIFANTVQFRAPDSLVINGAHAFRLEQRLAQLGIGGIG